VFGKCPTHYQQFNTLLTNSTRPRLFIIRVNYYNEEYCDVFVPGRNSRLQWMCTHYIKKSFMNNYESGELNFLDFNTRIPLRLFGLSIASIWTFITCYILLLCWSGLYFELLLPVEWSTFHK